MIFTGAGTTTSLDIDDGFTDRVARRAGPQRRSAQGIMLEAIADYLRREEAWLPFAEEAHASLSAYQATGRHLTGAKVTSWLEA